MIRTVLKAKHWQLFILTFGIPFLIQIIFMTSMMANLFTNDYSGPDAMFSYMKIFPVIMLLFMAVFFGWFWAIGIGLQAQIPNTINMKVNRFKFFFFFPIVYMLIILIYMSTSFTSFVEMEQGSSASSIAIIMGLIFPIHLFAMFCMFYLLYFSAKTIKTAELKREVTFSDFAGEFFMIWFFPIGIWIIQPRINKLESESAHTANTM